MKPRVQPELVSLRAFTQFLLDDERETFSPGEAQKVAENTGEKLSDIVAILKSCGFRPAIREIREVRGINSNNHDLYTEKNGWVSGCGIGSTSRHMVSHWQPK